jgi:3'-phosphoadenosine 5'-phosphosulfate sulfotransferase (PAPS reductase)/FAD synthetase
MTDRVVMFSGGVGSWAAAKRVAERHGTDGLVLLFADTLIEDADTYRFMREAAANVGGQLIEIREGRTPWEVFRDRRFLGNARVDPCSHHLKREPCDRWLAENCDPANTVVYVGIDWSEEHRYTRLRDLRAAGGWSYVAPLGDPPYLTKDDMHDWAKREGLAKQRLYVLGMPHANCGGGCVKMGQGGFARLLKADPCRFAEWEENEETLRAQLGDVSILRDRRGGTTTPLTLRALRQRIERDEPVDMFDIGGCGCFVDNQDGAR